MGLLSAISHRFRGAPAEVIEGYDQPELLDFVFRKTVAYQPAGDWPDMVGAGNVLDFGGACGLRYKLAAKQSPAIRWAVVETPAMVARAGALETDRLKFFATIPAAAAWLGDIEVMHSNGALQCTCDPLQTLKDLCALGARVMLWDRLYLGTGSETQISTLADNGPGRASRRIPPNAVTYARTAIPESVFLAHHSAAYRLVDRTDRALKFIRVD